jgi:hypothetical protein
MLVIVLGKERPMPAADFKLLDDLFARDSVV